MTKPNLKLNVSFDFDLTVPESWLQLDHDALCKTLHQALGATVTQGMPTVSAKQLAKAGVNLLSHHHHLKAVNLAAVKPPREALVAAAPHLTDPEIEQLSTKLAGKTPANPEELLRWVRRHALALNNEYRLVDCVVQAKLTSGAVAQLQGKLNLTQGSIVLSEKDRHNRLQSNQGPIPVSVNDTSVTVHATLSGQTLSGPVLGVEISDLAPHRDVLIERWLKQQ